MSSADLGKIIYHHYQIVAAESELHVGLDHMHLFRWRFTYVK